jgi:hypothetical protein
MEERSSSQSEQGPRKQSTIRRKPVAGHDSPIPIEYSPYRSPIEEARIPNFPVQYIPYRSPVDETRAPDIPVQYIPYRSLGDVPTRLHPTIYRRPSVSRRNTIRGRSHGGSFSTGSANRISTRASISNYSDYGVSPVSPMSPNPRSRRTSADEIIANVSREVSYYHSDSSASNYRAPLSPLMELSAQEAAFRSSFQQESSIGSPLTSNWGTIGSAYRPPGRGFRSSSITREGICNWLPLTLRWPFMMGLFLASLGLAGLTLGLTIRSQNYQGLGNDRGSSAFFFAWRFIPTLAAVIYGMLTSAVVVDIKRTEPYARLSRPDGASATSSLFLKPRMIFFELFDALTKSRNDGFRNWALFWALLINLLALLLIIPFSAAFLSPRTMLYTANTDFSRLSISLDRPLEFSKDNSTISQTISSILTNTSNSAWIAGDYVVLPVYPSKLGATPYSASLYQSKEEWTADTTIYMADLTCESMNLQNIANISSTRQISFPPNVSVFATVNLTSMVLTSDDGCSLGYAEYPPEFSPNTIFTSGGGWWSGGSNFSYPTDWSPDNDTADGLADNFPFMLNTSSECGDRDIFFLATAFEGTNFQAQGQVCKSSYFSAILPVTVSNTGDSTQITFNEIDFNIAKVPMSAADIDLTTLENVFRGQDWSSKFRSPDPGLNPALRTRPSLGGPLALLGAQNNFDLLQMISNPLLASQARQIKQKFFGESMLSAFKTIENQNPDADTDAIVGKVVTAERRIIVSFVAGIILTTVFLLSSLMVGIVVGYTRLDERPLNILRDPSSTLAIASLVSAGQNSRVLFEGMDTASQDWMLKSLARNVFYLRHGVLYSYDIRDTYQHTGKFSKSYL